MSQQMARFNDKTVLSKSKKNKSNLKVKTDINPKLYIIIRLKSFPLLLLFHGILKRPQGFTLIFLEDFQVFFESFVAINCFTRSHNCQRVLTVKYRSS